MSVNKFISTMNKSGGYARPSKFVVRVSPPGAIGSKLQALHNSMREQLYLNCNSVGMPGHDLQTQQLQHGSAPVRDMVTSHGLEGMITASFYLSADLRERHYFEEWQALAVDKDTHKANYYDDYIGKMEIYQLGSDNETFQDAPTYAIQATEVYPEKIGTMDYSYGANNQVQKITINFAYKQWFNMGIESLAGLEFGKSRQTATNVKARNEGIFGNLPPAVQRAGRGIINQGRTVLNPIGRIFKGKVFPPFF